MGIGRLKWTYADFSIAAAAARLNVGPVANLLRNRLC